MAGDGWIVPDRGLPAWLQEYLVLDSELGVARWALKENSVPGPGIPEHCVRTYLVHGSL